MYYLYILKSAIVDRHYIGTTSNPIRRLADHNSKSVSSTKAYAPWAMVYKEEFADKKIARQKEIFLKKTAKARIELFQKIIAPIV